MTTITTELLTAVMPHCAVAALWAAPLDDACAAYGITTPERVAMFLANVAHESAELTRLEENLNYTHAERLLAVFPRHFTDLAQAQHYINLGPEAIASRVYASRLGNGDESSGDGWDYRGRGPNGLTFKSNYIACSIAICGDADTLIKNPEFVSLPEFGATSAAWFWDVAGCSEAADAGDFDGVCDRINIGHKTIAMGDSNGFSDRKHYLDVCRAALA